MTTVTKEFTFDSAHMLSNHDGLCKNLHGHTYRLYVSVKGDTIQSGSSKGMLIDFKDLKNIINQCISLFDHAYLYDNTSQIETEIGLYLASFGMKVFEFPFRTTCENMCEYVFHAINRKLSSHHIEVETIKLYETPTSYAEYRSIHV